MATGIPPLILLPVVEHEINPCTEILTKPSEVLQGPPQIHKQMTWPYLVRLHQRISWLPQLSSFLHLNWQPISVRGGTGGRLRSQHV